MSGYFGSGQLGRISGLLLQMVTLGERNMNTKGFKIIQENAACQFIHTLEKFTEEI